MKFGEANVVEAFGKGIGVFAAACLGVSVVYDYAFLLAVGQSFDSVQTTIGDHARSALLWLPVVAFSFLISAGLGFVVGSMSGSDQPEFQPVPTKLKVFVDAAYPGILVLMSIGTPAPVSIALLSAAILLASVQARQIRGAIINAFGRDLGFVLIGLFALLQIVFVIGFFSGTSLNRETVGIRVEWTSNSQSRSTDARGVRWMGNSLIVVGRDSEVAVIRGDLVTRIVQTEALGNQTKPFGCSLGINSLCDRR